MSDSQIMKSFYDDNLTNPCNQSGFGKIVPEFVQNDNKSSGFYKASSSDTPLLEIEKRPISHFTHNNMVPYYGAKLTQNMRGTNVPQVGDNNVFGSKVSDGFADASPFRQKLSDYTGCDESYMHKREIGNMFSPVERNTSWVFGAPTIRPDLDRYKDSVWRRNGETPVEKIRVGPGIGLDHSIAASGGFHQYNRIRYNNVSDYKSNQLEGRVKFGKWQINHPTSQYTEGVVKNRPDKFLTQARRPTMKSRFYVSAPSAGSSKVTDYQVSVNRGRQAREDSGKASGYGQLKSNSDGTYCLDYSESPLGLSAKGPLAHTSDRVSFDKIRENFKRGKVKFVNGQLVECLDSEQGSNEWGIVMGPATGGNKQTQRDGYSVNFTDRGDANPYVINVTGNKKWNPNSYNDNARVTRKQTTNFSHGGNLAREGFNPMNRFMFEGEAIDIKETYTDIKPDIKPPSKKIRRGGMTTNGLRAATEVKYYTRNPGRMNIIPHANQSLNEKDNISSIGTVQTNSLKQVAVSDRGPGTLKRSNFQVGSGSGLQAIAPTEKNMGYTIQNEKRAQFVDYRHTDTVLVDNLRNNPLSIYAVGDAKNAEIPEFFTHTKPKTFSSYTSNHRTSVDNFTKQMTINGAPQTNILGLHENNPLMGISNVKNTLEYHGKSYGGDETNDNFEEHMNKIWTGNHFDEGECKNKAVKFVSSGYEVVPGNFNHFGAVTNLPWGPKKVTNNIKTQNGGIWNEPSIVRKLEMPPHVNNMRQYYENQVKNYKNGLPGSLVSF